MAIAPSPTAEATRLIELGRTSPVTKGGGCEETGMRVGIGCGGCAGSAP